MKKQVAIVAILAVFLVLLFIMIWRIKESSYKSSKSLAIVTKTTKNVPSLAERQRMTNAERIRLLEKIGCVPDDPDISDYMLAEKTSWWGKRLDPKSFWSNKVVWYDNVAEFEARRRGRGYPPIPYNNPSVDDRSDTDHRAKGSGADGVTIHFVSTEKEAAFWDTFIKTHPHPPQNIKNWYEDKAESWMHNKYMIEHEPDKATRFRVKPESINSMIVADMQDAKTFGYPSECVTPQAFRWAYIMKKRQEYGAILTNGQSLNSLLLSNYFRRLYVDPKYITEPLSAEDIKAANAWKVTYLRRLRQEKTDQSYINAYLQAWNLSSNEVFGVTH